MMQKKAAGSRQRYTQTNTLDTLHGRREEGGVGAVGVEYKIEKKRNP